jgi:hypothetical protein
VDADFVIETRHDVRIDGGVTSQVFAMSIRNALGWVLGLADLEQGVRDGVVFVAHRDRLDEFIASGGEGGSRYVASARVDGPLSVASRGQMESRLRDADPLVRLRAVRSLAWTERGEALRLALRASCDADARVRAQATWLLGPIGGEGALAAVREALLDEDDHVRRSALCCAGWLGEKGALELLEIALRRPSLATQAAWELCYIPPERSEALAREILERGTCEQRPAAISVLGRLGGKGLPDLKRLLAEDPDEGSRTAAACSLMEIGTDEALRPLERAIDSGDVEALNGVLLGWDPDRLSLRPLLTVLRTIGKTDDWDFLINMVIWLRGIKGSAISETLKGRTWGKRSYARFRDCILGTSDFVFPEVREAVEALAPREAPSIDW